MKLILSSIVVLLLSSTIFAAEPPIFVYDMVDAIALSENTNKQILVVFTADWCKQCQIMKKDIEDNQNMVSDTIVCYLNIDFNQDLAKEYNIKFIPDYCILRKKIQIRRQSGYTTRAKFIKWFQDDK
jgi:protein disulfide-isomerase